ncbi:2TM domain-containing protein [Ramlibacter sp.]|uniref:2TM domain-containing protein n=1 Tax=Ramlibacter sp. TaxID=1917967 RepID=UPI001810BAAC|nr:2TM domain-containing protein [Ramlibacter sp.]MBA2676528.1 2TM domain-containing protein [Ramlibacter sp.]
MTRLCTAVSTRQAAALRQARRRKGFYLHLLPYLLVVSGLAVVNLLLTPRYPWVLWVAFGWGIGLAMHGLATFGRRTLFG